MPLFLYLVFAACGGSDSNSTHSLILSPEGYKLKVEAIAESQGLQLNVFTHLLDKLDIDVSPFGDATWKADVAASIKRLRAYNNEFRAVSPPPCAREGHDALLKSADQLDRTFVTVERGIQEQSKSVIDDAFRQLNEWENLLDRAQHLLDDAPCRVSFPADDDSPRRA